MDTKDILTLSGVYYDIIEKLGKEDLLENVSIDGLMKDNKSLMQRAYKEMRQYGFKEGTLIDFICSISTAFVIDSLKRRMKPDTSLTEWALAIMDSYDEFRLHVRNTLRLWHSYDYSVEFMESIIHGVPLKYEPGEFYSDLEHMDDFLVMSSTFCQFLEILVGEDMTGEKNKFYDVLIERIRARAKINLEK